MPSAIMVLATLSFAAVYPLVPNAGRLTDQGKLVSYDPLALVAFLIGVGALAAAHVVILQRARDRTLHDLRRPVILTTAALLLGFMLMYPTNAIDVYIYAARSHLLTTFAENPNRALPLDYWDVDRFVRYSSKQWADNVSPYGPLWNVIAAPVTALDGDRILAAILGFKLLNIAALLAIAACIHDTVRRRAPEWALTATLLWLWNPLVLWEGIGNAHNDVVMMLPVAAAIWAWESGRIRWVIPLLVASALIKYVALVLLPVAVVAALFREPNARGRAALAMTAVGWTILLLNISLYPFYDVASLWDGIREQGGRVSGSLGYVVVRSGRQLGFGDDLAGRVRMLGYLVTLIAMAIGAVVCWRRPERLARVSLELATIFLLAGTMHVRAWYVIWIVALAAFSLSEAVRVRAIVWSTTALLAYAHYIWVRRVWPSETIGWFWFEIVGVAIVLGPAVALCLREVWGWRRQRIVPLATLPAATVEPSA